MSRSTNTLVKYVKGLMYAVASTFVISFPAHVSYASVVTSGCINSNSCTLQELVDGGSINIDDIAFNNWQEIENFLYALDANDDEVEDFINLSEIFVFGIDAVATANPDEYILGLQFSSETAFTLPQQSNDIQEAELELDVDYDVTASNGALITAAELLLGNRVLESDDAFVEVNLDSSTGLNLQVYDEFIDPDFDTVESDSDTFATGLADLTLTSNVQAGTFEPGSLSLFDFSLNLTVQALPTDPEPEPVPTTGNFLLMVFGISLLAFNKKRKPTSNS